MQGAEFSLPVNSGRNVYTYLYMKIIKLACQLQAKECLAEIPIHLHEQEGNQTESFCHMIISTRAIGTIGTISSYIKYCSIPNSTTATSLSSTATRQCTISQLVPYPRQLSPYPNQTASYLVPGQSAPYPTQLVTNPTGPQVTN